MKSIRIIAFTFFMGLLPLRAQQPASVDNEVIVKFQPGASMAAGTAPLSIVQSTPVGRDGAYRLRSGSLSTASLVSALKQRPDVVYAEPNYTVHAIATPNDPLFSQLWGMQTISAPLAWDISSGSPNSVVAIVDTGIDYTHPDLAPNVWSAPAPFNVTIAGGVISCPAGSHGFNAITKSCDPRDDNYHGTHVSGTIGAKGNNGQGVAGVNWLVGLMGAKFLGSNGSGQISDAINAIDFVLQVKQIFGPAADVRVLSNSWGGGGFSQALQDEISLANQNGVLFVAAAGNSGGNNDINPSYPASYNVPNVMSVAATDSSDHLASFSNFGAISVHLAAPGVNILSTYSAGGYSTLSGTSMAAPHVSGAAALVASVCPGLSAANLKAALLANVDLVPGLKGITYTGGRLNVNKAIQSCATDQNLTNLTLTSGTYTYSASNSITASATTISQDASVLFEAGYMVTLSPEFRATAGTAPITFHARTQY